MGNYNGIIDEYIAGSAEFAKPILRHLRELVHKACPETEEKMKWSFPHFDYKGQFCNMAAFKHHCSFGFWKASLMSDNHHLFQFENAMGALGKITSLEDLPPDDVLLSYLQEAMKLNDEGRKLPNRQKTADKTLEVPADLLSALQSNAAAKANFENFAYSHRKEYVQWINEAKRGETRTRRIEQAVEMLAQGHSRNYKYEK